MCKSRDLHEAMVFLLGMIEQGITMNALVLIRLITDRMGNPQAALQIIVSDLKDVDKVFTDGIMVLSILK